MSSKPERFNNAATLKVRLPANIQNAAVAEPSQTILWRPGDVVT